MTSTNISINKGILHIVATPIGNLKDITYRAIEILKKVNIIVVENIFHTQILLNKYKINKKLITLNKINEKKKTIYIINLLLKGKNIALVSNAGTPTINDPGNYLINSCYTHNIKITSIPGACAAISALSISGLSYESFIYKGFFPKERQKKLSFIKELNNYKNKTIIFFENPKKILSTLKYIYKILKSNYFIFIAKELTKIWETIYRGKLIDIIDILSKNNTIYKGEFVIIIYVENFNTLLNSKIKSTIDLLKDHIPTKVCVNLVKSIFNIKKKNLIYKYLIKKEK